MAHDTAHVVLADVAHVVVAAVHAAAVVLMLTGALLALRWPRLLLAHVPVAVGILVINRAGVDCPLTTLELWLRARSGGEVYSGGFLGHYAFAPVGVDVANAPTQTGIFAAALLPNGVGYGLLVARVRRRRTRTAATEVPGVLAQPTQVAPYLPAIAPPVDSAEARIANSMPAQASRSPPPASTL